MKKRPQPSHTSSTQSDNVTLGLVEEATSLYRAGRTRAVVQLAGTHRPGLAAERVSRLDTLTGMALFELGW